MYIVKNIYLNLPILLSTTNSKYILEEKTQEELSRTCIQHLQQTIAK